MPYLVLDGTSVYDRLRQPKFHLVTFSKQGESEIPASEIKPEYAGLIDFADWLITSEVIEKFGIDLPFTVFLRPDNYIAFISTERSWTEVTAYLNEFMRRRSSLAAISTPS